MTKIMWSAFVPDASWQYGLWRVEEKGKYVETQPVLTKAWDNLVQEARDINCPHVPQALAQRHFLLALFLIIVPFRGSPEVIRYLGWKFDQNWFIQLPVEQ
jgi:hypothetical protein